MQIVVAFEQQDTSQIDQQQQLYIAQCEQRKVQYQKSKIPWRIEEALEEFVFFLFYNTLLLFLHQLLTISLFSVASDTSKT